MKINKIKAVFFRQLVILCKVWTEISCFIVKVDFVNYIFNNYKKGIDDFSNYNI